MSLVPVTEFGAILGVSKQRVTDMIAMGMPASPPGKRGAPRMIDTAIAIRWVTEQAVAKVRTPDGGETEAQAGLRRARADADLAEVRAAQAANQVVELSAVQAMIERAMVMVASLLDGIGGRIAAQVAVQSDAAICRQMIFDECRRAREALATELEAGAALAHGREGDPPAAEADAGPVGRPVPDEPAR